MDKLKAMVTTNLVFRPPNFITFNNREVCVGCQYGKSHRGLFDKSLSKYKALLELIHRIIVI